MTTAKFVRGPNSYGRINDLNALATLKGMENGDLVVVRDVDGYDTSSLVRLSDEYSPNDPFDATASDFLLQWDSDTRQWVIIDHDSGGEAPQQKVYEELVLQSLPTVGATVPTGYSVMPMTALFDPYNQFNTSTNTYLGTSGYLYRINITLSRLDTGNPISAHRPNSATVIPFSIYGTGQSFAHTYTGFFVPNNTARSTMDAMRLYVNNPSGAPWTISGSAFDRGYWQMAIYRSPIT